MKKIFFLILFVGLIHSSLFAQNYVTHRVQKGENIESIAKKYRVTPYDIYLLNPDAKKGLSESMILLIPTEKQNTPVKEVEIQKEVIGYRTHKVKRKETLYSIAKEYGVEVDEIKKYNSYLYSNNLRKGDKIKIPRFKRVLTDVPFEDTGFKNYTVQPREGKWRVAYKFGITIPQLEELNPQMNDTLQPGDVLKVPNLATNEENMVNEQYNYYTVQKSEGYMALERKFGVTKEELEALNPELLEDGLKLGMILKLPKDVTTTPDLDDVRITKLQYGLNNFETKKIALMLPFKLDRVDTDSVALAKSAIRNDVLLGVALDFHTGVLIALDSAKQFGISTHLKVFDTRNSSAGISDILLRNNFNDFDAVIGPMMDANFQRVANELSKDNVPAISPLTMPKTLRDNMFQTVPSKELLEQTIINYFKKDSSIVKVVIIHDEANQSVANQLLSAFPAAKEIKTKRNKEGKEMLYIAADNLIDVFRNGRNLVFLQSSDEGFISNVTSIVNGFVDDEHEIVLTTTDKNSGFEGENVSNVHLSNLKFHYPSVNRSFDGSKENSFISKYRKIYGIEPNRYAIRGFDLTLDLLLRLASGENLYETADSSIQTEYIENKFRYAKKMFGGYTNESVYVVKYDNLAIVQVE